METATTVLNTVQRSNACMLIDMLHFYRSNSSLEALKNLPREWFPFAHVCDGPATIGPGMDSILHEARSDRLFPGEGAFGVKDILACLPDPITYCLEIPGEALAVEIGFEEYARRALQAARNCLD
jgi:sugar phosphate isomerase/epimerase